MYIPKHNVAPDEALIHRLVAEHSFATLLVPRPDGQIEISHLPFLFDTAAGVLRAHVARANRIWRDAVRSSRPGDVVVVFAGPHGYVSPTWYERGKEDVPTWNYAVAHAHVTAPAVMEEAELVTLLDDLAKANERGPAPWQLAEHPADSLKQMVTEIVGLTLPVARWEAKLKLSQNRTATDHARVVAAFEQRATPDDIEMAALMRQIGRT